MHHFELAQREDHTYSVKIDGFDISEMVDYLHFEIEADALIRPRVLIRLAAEANAEAAAEVVLDDLSQKMLLRLGWTPPRKPGAPELMDANEFDRVFQAWCRRLVIHHGDKPTKDTVGSAMLMADLVKELGSEAVLTPEAPRELEMSHYVYPTDLEDREMEGSDD